MPLWPGLAAAMPHLHAARRFDHLGAQQQCAERDPAPVLILASGKAVLVAGASTDPTPGNHPMRSVLFSGICFDE